MSKIIGIFVFFLMIIAVSAAIFHFTVPQSLETLKSEIISEANKNGFEMEIEKVKFVYPDIVEFENIFAMNELGIIANTESCKLKTSIFDYVKSVFQKRFQDKDVEFKDFTNDITIDELKLFFVKNGTKELENAFETGENMVNASLKIFFDSQSSNNWFYSLKTDSLGIFNHSLKNVAAFGIVGSENISLNFNYLGGNFLVAMQCDWKNSMLVSMNISFENIDLQQIIPDNINASGLLSGTINPTKFPTFSTDNLIDDIIMNTEAECSLSVKNFKLDDNKFSKPILDAVLFVGINDLNFQELTANIYYSYLNTDIKNLLADNFKYKVSAQGSLIPKTQKFNLNTEIHFNPDMKFVIQRNIWNSMLSAEPNNEGRKLTGKISGNTNNVSVTLDGEIMKKGINSILSEIEKLF